MDMQTDTDQTPQQELPFYRPQGNDRTVRTRLGEPASPVLIKGPTGCGKTRFVQHMAARPGRPLYTVACHDDLTAADPGRHLIGESGTYWCDGPPTRAVREGAICYLDEVVEARKGHHRGAASVNRRPPYPAAGAHWRDPQAPPGFMLVVPYNPGYQNLFEGDEAVDPAALPGDELSDFPGPELRTSRCCSARPGSIGPRANAWCDWRMHCALKTMTCEEAASTRLLVRGPPLTGDGFEVREACRAAMVETAER